MGEEPPEEDDSEEELERAAEIERKTVSLEEAFDKGLQRAQLEREAAENMASKFQDASVEQLVKAEKPRTAAPDGAKAAPFGDPVKTRRYSQ